MAATAPKVDPAAAITAIREARPPTTDRFTYLTIVEANLCPEVLPVLNEVLQDAELTQEIGWDLVFNLVSLPGSEACLETVARLGNPREVILKVLETLELLGGDAAEEEERDQEEDGKEGSDKATKGVSLTHKFITLLGMLAIVYKRIQTKHPSRFLAQTLSTVLSTYRPSQEMTASVINLVHSLSGRRRPPLPSRQSSVDVTNLDRDGGASRNAPDPEADRDEERAEDPSEGELQQRLLLSFTTCVLEAYVNGNDMAWAARLLEFFNPDKIVPGRRTLMAAFREEKQLLERDAIVGKLVALISDLGLGSCSKSFIRQLCDGPTHSDPLAEAGDLSRADQVPLSTGGCVCLVAYWVFSATVFDATHPRPEMHIFPELFAVLDKFLQDDAHSQIQKSVGTVEALVALGLWLQCNNLVSADPTSPVTNSSTSPEEPSDIMQLIHLVTLVSLYHPQIQVRNAASVLAGQILHSDPSDDDRLKILEDLLENCMFASLKARAVAWLREELIAAANAASPLQPQQLPEQEQQQQRQQPLPEEEGETQQRPPPPPAGKEQPQQANNLFATPQALEALQYVVFPPLTSYLDLPAPDLAEYLTANAPFLLQAVNFALFLWGGSGAPTAPTTSTISTTLATKEGPANTTGTVGKAGIGGKPQSGGWAHVLPANMEAAVRERYLGPLGEVVERVEVARKSGELAGEGLELGPLEGELAVLRDRLGILLG